MIFGFEVLFITAAVIVIVGGIVYLVHDMGGRRKQDKKDKDKDK
jgi:hypothetical protein